MVNFQYWRHFFLSLVEGCHAKEVSQGWSAWVTETVTQFFVSRQLTNRWKVVNLTKEPHFCVWFIWIEVKMRKRMDVVGTSLQNCQMSVPHPLSVRNTVYWLSVITSALFLHSFQSRFLENIFQTKNCPKNCFWYSTIFFCVVLLCFPLNKFWTMKNPLKSDGVLERYKYKIYLKIYMLKYINKKYKTFAPNSAN